VAEWQAMFGAFVSNGRRRIGAACFATAVVATALLRAQEPTTLSSGAALDRDIAIGQPHTYRLTLAAGDFVRVTIEQKGADIAATLVRPDGRALLTVDSSLDIFRPETIVAIADVSGVHTLSVRTSRNGLYAIRVDDLRAASASDQERVAAERAFERGWVLHVTNQPAAYRQALPPYHEALDLYRRLGDRLGETKVAIELAAAQELLSLPEALAAAKRAEELTRSGVDEPARAKALYVLGRAYNGAGEREGGIRAIEESVALFRRLGDRRGEATSLNTLGAIYDQGGDSEQGVATYEQVRLLTQAEGGTSRMVFGVLNNLGISYKNLGQYDKALELYEQALAIAIARSDRDVEAVVLNNMGNVERLLGNYQKGLDLHRRALVASRASGGQQNEARSLNTMGTAYYQLGDYARALEYHRESLEIRRRLADRLAESASLSGVGRALHRLGDYGGALEALRETLAIRRGLGDQYGEADSLQHLALLERDQGQLREALRHIEASVDLEEALRERITSPELRASYVAAEQNKYELFVDVLQRLHVGDASGNHAAAALKISERARARVLLESWVDGRGDLREGRPARARALVAASAQRRLDAALSIARGCPRQRRHLVGGSGKGRAPHRRLSAPAGADPAAQSALRCRHPAATARRRGHPAVGGRRRHGVAGVCPW
jgi:tetratricopeptide (TPR) repeat protein